MRTCAPSVISHLRRVFQVGQLLNVVHEPKQFPLCVDFVAIAQCAIIKSLVVAQICKHRFDDSEASRIWRAALVGTNAAAHLHGAGLAFNRSF